MNRIVVFCVLLAGLLGTGCGGGGGQVQHREPPPPPADRPFDMLDPYGDWMEVPGRGPMWKPHVMYDWMPYTTGRWVWTDRGWLWDSEEPFGWVVYHYGFWEYRAGLGWLWMPGYQWSPARVRWFESEEYVGWAPVPPTGVILPRPGEDAPERWWTIVPHREFLRDSFAPFHRLNLSGFQGPYADHEPDVAHAERWGGRPIPMMRLDTERIRMGSRDLVRARPSYAPATVSPPPQQFVPPPEPRDLPRAKARQVTPPPPVTPPTVAPRTPPPSSGGNVLPPRTGANRRAVKPPAPSPAKQDTTKPRDRKGDHR